LAHRHPGNLNVRFPDVDATALLQNLHPNVAASTGSACTSGQPEPSHVLAAIGLSAQQSNESIRLSIGRFTTIDEIAFAVRHISDSYKALHDATI
jgi:cysteine desulfurase